MSTKVTAVSVVGDRVIVFGADWHVVLSRPPAPRPPGSRGPK